MNEITSDWRQLTCWAVIDLCHSSNIQNDVTYKTGLWNRKRTCLTGAVMSYICQTFQFLQNCHYSPFKTRVSVKCQFYRESTQVAFKDVLVTFHWAVRPPLRSCHCAHSFLSVVQFYAFVSLSEVKRPLWRCRALVRDAVWYCVLYKQQVLFQFRHAGFAFMRPGRLNPRLSFHSSL